MERLNPLTETNVCQIPSLINETPGSFLIASAGVIAGLLIISSLLTIEKGIGVSLIVLSNLELVTITSPKEIGPGSK